MDGKESEERGRALVQTLAVVVESMVRSSDSVPMAYYQKTKFEAFRAPGISIRDYLLRIHKYASCSPECFVLALVYIDRLHKLQGFVLTELNVHRVLISSIVLAAKFFDDHYFNNAYYAKVGGVPCSEMNELEVEFLLLINFSLHVCTETYAKYYNELANHYIFTSVQNATMPPPPFRHFRHYVTEDPHEDGQLVYVTEGVSAEPEPVLSRKRVEREMDVSPSYVSQPIVDRAPAVSNGHHGGFYPSTHHHSQHPVPSFQPHRSMHHHHYGFEDSSCNPPMNNEVDCPNSTRPTSQKRRSIVPLGVNA